MADELYFTQEDLQVFTQYGLTMLRVQQFEYAVKQLAQLQTELPEDATFEQAWKPVQKILTSAVGTLTQQLEKHGKTPEELLEEIRAVTRGRNNLAHEYLLWYVLQKNHGLADPQEAVMILQAAEQNFQELDTQLLELSHALMREHGIDPDKDYITNEEGREILREMLAEQENAEGR